MHKTVWKDIDTISAHDLWQKISKFVLKITYIQQGHLSSHMQCQLLQQRFQFCSWNHCFGPLEFVQAVFFLNIPIGKFTGCDIWWHGQPIYWFRKCWLSGTPTITLQSRCSTSCWKNMAHCSSNNCGYTKFTSISR
jgi:hypothetical protein